MNVYLPFYGVWFWRPYVVLVKTLYILTFYMYFFFIFELLYFNVCFCIFWRLISSLDNRIITFERSEGGWVVGWVWGSCMYPLLLFCWYICVYSPIVANSGCHRILSLSSYSVKDPIVSSLFWGTSSILSTQDVSTVKV